MNVNKSSDIPFIGDIFIRHINISDKILDVYYSLVPQPETREDVPSKNYVGKPNRYYAPYKANPYGFGAYPLMKYWEALEYKMENHNDINGSFQHYQPGLVAEHFKIYADGFKVGYANFLKNIIDKNELMDSIPVELKLKAIVDYVSNPFNDPGFSEKLGSGNSIFDGWYDDGVLGGYYYKAWYLILNESSLFEQFFPLQKTERPLENQFIQESGTDRGYPTDLWSFMDSDKLTSGLKDNIVKLIRGKKGRDLSHLIHALTDLGFLLVDYSASGNQKALYNALLNLGAAGTYQGFSAALGTNDNKNPKSIPDINKIKICLITD